MDQFFAVKLDNGSSVEIKAQAELGLKPHDLCIFRREFYTDMGEIARELEKAAPVNGQGEIPVAQRKAEPADLSTANDNDMRARSALRTAHALVENLGLGMKLLNAHYSLDGKLVTIQFSADGRVDFRELVKELSRALCTRIELRQIGVRDETSIYGGIAVCGQQLCCRRFLKEFNSINVKMAKEQDLSLTPATISGACGRLKCCLKYEHEGYQELEKGMPKRGEWCDTPQGRGRICDRNLLTRKVSVQLESGNVSWFLRDEITIQAGERGPRNGGGNNGGNRRNNDNRQNRTAGEQQGKPGNSNRGDRNRPPRNNRNGGGSGDSAGGNGKEPEKGE